MGEEDVERALALPANSVTPMGYRCSDLRLRVGVAGLVFASGVAILKELVLSTSILPAIVLGMARVATESAVGGGGRGSNKSTPHSRRLVLATSALVILTNERILDSYLVQIIFEQEG
jgi:hypothetical protein